MRSMQIDFKYWFKFIKDESLKFISHLDLLRAFERAIRRSNMPVCYSQGYNPRQRLSFALPLAVGLKSIAEYGEIILSKNIQTEEIKMKINENLPRSLFIEDVVKVSFNFPTIMSKISHAEYKIIFENNFNKDKITTLLNQDIISYKKRTKNKEQEINLKDYIYKIKMNGNTIEICLKSGSQGHIKPTEFIEACLGNNAENLNIIRTEIYIEEGNRLITPFQYALQKLDIKYG